MKNGIWKVAVRIAASISLSLLAGCFDLAQPSSTATIPGASIATDNEPPVINGTADPSAIMGAPYSFTPSASDADGDELTFQIEAKPSWAEFDESSGSLIGLPLLTDVGMYTSIAISVSDGEQSTSLPNFSINVSLDPSVPPANPPPIDPPVSTPPVDPPVSPPPVDPPVSPPPVDPPANPPPVDPPVDDPPTNPPAHNYIGFGSVTLGAGSCPTGMTTYRVTSLSGGNGAGTIRDGVSADCRHIVFDVGGDIDLGDLQISASYLTIDGSTAPAPGISFVNVERLAFEPVGGQDVHDIIVNNIRTLGTGDVIQGNGIWEMDGTSAGAIYNVVLDHLTIGRAGDGFAGVKGNVHDVTLSNSALGGATQGQEFSPSSGSQERISIFGNVFAQVNAQQPRIGSTTRQLDFVGNVIYGWGWNSGSASGLRVETASENSSVNIENNVYQYVAGLNGGEDDALVMQQTDGAWFFTNNSWPVGESTGDGASTSTRVSMNSQGIDYAAPRRLADIMNAGTHFQTANETAYLNTIRSAIAGPNGGGGDTGGGDTGGGDTGGGDTGGGDTGGGDTGGGDTGGGDTGGGDTGGGDTGGGDTGGGDTGGGDTGGGGGGGYVPPINPSAYQGIPDPSAELGFDVWGSFPTDQAVSGSRGSDSLSCTGTASNPCVIDASGASFSKLSLSGSYVILQGGIINAPAGSGPWFSSSSCSNCVIRDLEVAGPGQDSSHSTAVSLGSRTVWIRGSVHGFGDNRVNAAEQDFHGFKVQASDVWILEAEIYDLSGDSVQVGDASRGSGERVYMGGGYYHHNRENGVDIKDSRDVVVSGVLMEGFRPTGSSPGEAIIIHDDAYDAKVFNNVIRDSTLGMVSSGRDGHIIQNNNITALSVGLQLRNTTNMTVTGNTIVAPTPVQVQGGVTGNVQSN